EASNLSELQIDGGGCCVRFQPKRFEIGALRQQRPTIRGGWAALPRRPNVRDNLRRFQPSESKFMKAPSFQPATSDVRVAGAILGIVIYCLFSGDAAAQIQQAWVARYNNGIAKGTHQAVKLLLDASGNIYVTGFSQ